MRRDRFLKWQILELEKFLEMVKDHPLISVGIANRLNEKRKELEQLNRATSNKIFISGKITGERIRECVHKFEDAEYELVMRHGFFINNVVSPLELPGIHFGIPHAEAMKICMEALKECTHIYMLKDWKESKGATMEHEWAKENGLEIIYE